MSEYRTGTTLHYTISAKTTMSTYFTQYCIVRGDLRRLIDRAFAFIQQLDRHASLSFAGQSTLGSRMERHRSVC